MYMRRPDGIVLITEGEVIEVQGVRMLVESMTTNGCLKLRVQQEPRIEKMPGNPKGGYYRTMVLKEDVKDAAVA